MRPITDSYRERERERRERRERRVREREKREQGKRGYRDQKEIDRKREEDYNRREIDYVTFSTSSSTKTRLKTALKV